jgi:hypothetical protein
MTVIDLPRTQSEPTPESLRVAELQEMIRSGRYEGYLDELLTERDKAKAARDEMRRLTAGAALEA